MDHFNEEYEHDIKALVERFEGMLARDEHYFFDVDEFESIIDYYFERNNLRRTKAVIFTDSGHIVLAALAPETIASRLLISRTGKAGPGESDDEP